MRKRAVILAARQGGDVQAAHLDQVAGEVPEPSDQLALANVRLAHLPVEPEHERFRGPAIHVHVQGELLRLAREQVGDAVAVEVDLEAARGLADGELDDRARVHPRLHLPGEAGDRVVRLVHDHQRTVDVEQVREGELDPAVFQPLQIRRGLRDAGEVGLQVLVVGRCLKSMRSRARVAGVSRDCSP